MSIVKVDVVPGGEEGAAPLAARARTMDGADGFLGFEVLRPTDGRSTWLVLTRWRDEVAHDLWRGSSEVAVGADGRNTQTWTFSLAAGSGVD